MNRRNNVPKLTDVYGKHYNDKIFLFQPGHCFQQVFLVVLLILLQSKRCLEGIYTFI